MAAEAIGSIQSTIVDSRGRLTAAYFATFVALGLTTGSLGPTLPALATQTQSSLNAISYLFTFRSLGYVVGSALGGKLVDRQPGNLVMSTMLLLATAPLLLIPFSTRLATIMGLMFVLGAAEAGLDVGANTLLVRVHGPRVAPFMNGMHSCFGVGALIAPIIVARLPFFGQQVSTQGYLLLAMVLLAIAAFVVRLPSPAPIAAGDSAVSSGRKASVFWLALFLFLYVGAEVGFAGWIFSYTVTTGLGTVAAAAYLTSLFWGSLTLGRALAIPIAGRVEPDALLLVSLVGAIASLLLILIFEHSLFGVSLGTAALGFSMASIFPATLSFASRRLRVTGRMTGWFVVGSSLGATSIPLAIGQMFSGIGPRSVILLPAFALLLGGVVLVVLKCGNCNLGFVKGID
jgi:MFS transporter, FHS family, Na+ dependent glucose transporter 1